MNNLTVHIEAKVKQAEDNIKNSYRQYIDDIEGLKALMPEEQRYIINELAAEADRRQERLLTIAGIYLRPYVTAHIQLRNKIFYYRVELPRVNNKRRYKIISLHTKDYFEAKERIKQMVALEEQFVRLQRLFNNLIFEKADNSDIMTVVSPFDKKRLSKRNDVKDVSELYSLYCSMAQDIKNLTEEKQALIKKIESLEGVIKEFIGPLNTMMAEFNKAKPVNPIQETTSYTIAKVLESMMLLKQATNRPVYQNRKKQTIVNLLTNAGLSLEDDYFKFHNVEMIEKISKGIINNPSLKNDVKKMKVRYLKELATCGHNINPDLYKANIINNFPQIENTKRIDKNPHLPYKKEQLLEMFNPKHTYFKDNPTRPIWTSCLSPFKAVCLKS